MATPSTRVRLWLAVALALAAAVLAGLLLWPPKAMLPGAPSEALLAAAEGLDQITLDVTLDPQTRMMQVSQRMTLTNRTGAAQQNLTLRAYANAFASEDTSPAATEELYDVCYPAGFSPGQVSVQRMQLAMDGQADVTLPYTYLDAAATVLQLALPTSWGAGQAIRLEVEYSVVIPQAAHRFGVSDGVMALGNVFLIPAPYLNGAPVTDAYYSIGEPFVSECRNYTVRLTLPLGFTVAATAAPVPQGQAAGMQTLLMDAPAVRDFALCVSRDWHSAQAMQAGVLVSAYAKSPAVASAMLDTAKAALAAYGARYGAYPYPAYTLCETTLPLESMAYPGLSMIDAQMTAQGGDALAQCTAIQVAHQWWGAVIGTDAYRQPWQDEALCEFSLLGYWATRHGDAAAQALAYARLETAMRVTIPRGVTPGSPIDYFGDWAEYRVVVMGRGGAAMLALDMAMDGGLEGFLRDYYQRYSFRIATRTDFENLLAAFTGQDWAPLLRDYLDTYVNN